ncbi:MAG: PHP domain-containing protein [Lachnospiraceae bacterium]|nr:PHP domain-containing protein [Lachnospiraceae bacterium]
MEINRIRERYPYLYETHCHSSESSRCATDSAVTMAAGAKASGYSGMILTNHNWGGNTAIDRELSWSDFLDAFFAPYFTADKWAKANDFQVFPGYEAGYDGTEFLIYGIDIGWMYGHPELRDATVAEQFDIIHSGGGIVVHAHPYREAFYIKEVRLYPEYIDGVEGINTAHTFDRENPRPDHDENALKYARSLGMFITGGSDAHDIRHFRGGMAFPEKLDDIHDFAARLAAARPDSYRVTNGDDWYDAYGGKI